ncbi:MAG: hypothetical protein JSS49_27710 [Planctomycetes bacterium]|nr:hypothetical protein [Planctomycetota bacterium]
MAAFMGRRWMRICASSMAMYLSLAVCGCVVGSKSMSVDSISKMPWFGLELKERKRKSDGPQFRSVRSEGESRSRFLGLFGGSQKADPARIEVAGHPAKVSTALPRTDQDLVLDSTAKPGAVAVDFH